MIRILITEAVLFALPFVAFFIYRVATRGWTGAAVAKMPWPIFALTMAGGALVVAGLIVFAMQDHAPRGAYVPAHTEDGRLVPGGFRDE